MLQTGVTYLMNNEYNYFITPNRRVIYCLIAQFIYFHQLGYCFYYLFEFTILQEIL